MLQLQNNILEMIAKGDTLASTIHCLCVEVEKLAPEVICSVLMVDGGKTLRPLAGPSLPAEYSAALDGLELGPLVGSCGTAAYLRCEVAVTDIATDPKWAEFKHLALPLGVRACWSSPILNAEGEPVGTFAFYFRTCRGPTEFEKEIVRHCVHLCAIALDRHHRMTEQERRASKDALTGLSNRSAFSAALAELDREMPGEWALLAIDLDNLKIVNDTFGHQAGDSLLKVAGERIVAQAAPDRAFRIGGDEFAVIVRSEAKLQDLESAADEILAALAEPADCAGHTIVPRATIGGAAFAHGDMVAERVRQNADFALYHAKETGRGGFVRYWPGLGTNITRRLTAIREVDAALIEDRIEPFYQPIVRLDTREIVGVEALCRMRLGDRILCADQFQEATKDIHIATAMTARMMKLIAADVRAWLDLGIPFQHVGINVSSADMHGGLLERVLVEAFEQENVPLNHVILEVTETVYMGDPGRHVRKTVQALRRKGLRVALDDFGTGYASLTHLLSVPVDIIKIDKEFVDGLAPGVPKMAIVEGLIQIAKKLDMHVVAEGIETEDQAEQLWAAGCVLGQGYLFSHAVDRQAATALLLDRAQYVARHGGAEQIRSAARAAG